MHKQQGNFMKNVLQSIALGSKVELLTFAYKNVTAPHTSLDHGNT